MCQATRVHLGFTLSFCLLLFGRVSAEEGQSELPSVDDPAVVTTTYYLDSYIQMARLFEAAPNYKPAQAIVDKIRSELSRTADPRMVRFLREQVARRLALAQKTLENGEFVNARERFEAILVVQPNNADAQRLLQAAQERLANATEELFKAGMDALQAGHYEKAQEFFSHALALNPQHERAKIEYGKVSLLIQTAEEARRWQSDLETLKDSYILGTQYSKAGQFEKAYLSFKGVLEIDPLHAQAQAHLEELQGRMFQEYFSHGMEEIRSGKLSKAVEDLSRALTFNPKNAEARAALETARNRLIQQKKIEAQRLYRKGLEAIQGGNKKAAIDFWQKAVEQDPENLDAKRGLERLRSK